MAESQKSEQRRHFRGKARPGRRVDLTYWREGGEKRGAITQNIGVGGAFITTDEPEEVGTQLTLQLQLPTVDNPIHLECEVRWVNRSADGAGMGVRFHNIDVEELLVLSEYFASLTGTDD